MVDDGYKADFPSEIIREGKVQVLVPKLAAYGVVPSDYAPSRAPVFYNPVMEFNRDLTVLAFQAYQRMVNQRNFDLRPLNQPRHPRHPLRRRNRRRKEGVNQRHQRACIHTGKA